MDPHAPPSLLSSVYRLFADERRRQATDRDLLQAFVQRGENDAFAELLRRHGPMVLHLALHLLHHRQDAEDVFQATFLTLARKAHTLRKVSSVAAWLHRVAWRLAVRNRAASKRRSKPLSSSLPSEQRGPTEEISLRESQELLHQELAALPERVRLPLVLCYLQGHTRDEAARRLGWSLGTLIRRLEQGRKLLHVRLSRRGVTLPAVLSGLLLAAAEVPASLAASTLGLATAALNGSASVPASVAVLLAEMTSSVKAKALWSLVLMLGACAGAGAWIYRGQSGEPIAPPEARPADKGEKAPVPLRDRFGDPLPSGAIARLGTVRWRHADFVRKIAFAADGKTVVSAGGDGVRVWDAATGKPVRHFAAGVFPQAVALSADGKRIAFSRHHAGTGGPIDVWDVATGKLLSKLGNQHYSQVCFSPDGKRLAGLSGDFAPGQKFLPWQIEIWNAAGRLVHKINGGKEYVSDMCFAADGASLLVGGESNAISIREVAGGKEIRRLDGLPLEVHTLVLSPRGDRVAVIELWKKKTESGQFSWGPGTCVLLIDLRTGAVLRRWSFPAEFNLLGTLSNSLMDLSFSPDGKKLAACLTNGPIYIWDLQSEKEVRLRPEGRERSGGLAFSADGRTLAVGNCSRVVRLLDAGTGADRVADKSPQGDVRALAVAADGRTVFTADSNGGIYRWDARTGREVGRFADRIREVTGLAPLADGRNLCSFGNDNTLRIWDLNTGKDRILLKVRGRDWWANPILAPDGRTLAVPSDTKEFLLFDLNTQKILHRLTTKSVIVDAAFTADGSVVAVLTGAHTICRWETKTGRRLPNLSLPPDRDVPPIGNPDSRLVGESMVLSPDGRLAAHGFGGKFLSLVDVSRQCVVHRTANPPDQPASIALPGQAAPIRFAADGRTLAWAEESGTIHWLELATWSERRRFSGHAGAVRQMAFTADGKRLISGSADTTALVWDLLGDGPTTLSVEQRDACWTDLADKDAAKAYHAMCRLIAAPVDALALLRSQLGPIEGVDEKHIERLIADLKSDAFAVRDKATKDLRKLGELAEPACRRALAARPALEIRRRLQELLDEVAQHQWHPAPGVLRQLRAIEVLERLGTPETQKLLETLANGAAGARLTREARAAVQRLKSEEPLTK